MNYNFFGRDDFERMYGVSGAGLPFEFDGIMFVQLDTGVDGYTPIKISAHQAHLFIGYKEGSAIRLRDWEASELRIDGRRRRRNCDRRRTHRHAPWLPGHPVSSTVGIRTNYLVGTSQVDFAAENAER